MYRPIAIINHEVVLAVDLRASIDFCNRALRAGGRFNKQAQVRRPIDQVKGIEIVPGCDHRHQFLCLYL